MYTFGYNAEDPLKRMRKLVLKALEEGQQALTRLLITTRSYLGYKRISPAYLAALMVINTNPLTTQTAFHATNPATTVNVAEAQPTTEPEPIVSEYLEKPVILATTMGVPEQKLIEERAKAAQKAKKQFSVATLRPNQVNGNLYPYGYCTWFVKAKRSDIPNNMGHAKAWLNSAKVFNIATGSEPKVGAIVVTTESSYGHVAYIESIENDTLVISEMNFKGWGKTSTRSLNMTSKVIKGYIY